MSRKARALLIALIGPAVQALGALWVLANVAIDTGRELTIRYVIFDPGHLTIAVGIALSVVCIPLALDVAANEIFHDGTYSFQIYGDSRVAKVSLVNDTHVQSVFQSAEWEALYHNRANTL